ncbi:MAG TPA: DUF4381 domain-containing protein [Parachlamydiaceae bacterium]|nr:DUF4381 domain-containing protein [Parachlamydiaceae bacterium]
MNALLEQLHDIEGLDAISRWPLALGWWILIAVGLITLISLGLLAFRWVAFKRSWKNDTFKKLAKLESDLSEKNSRETAMVLSEYLRRIALKRYSRSECAGLEGDAWLKWLALKDSKEFDWTKKGRLLNEAPYAPVNYQLPASQIKELIQATRNWVR